MTDDLAQRVSSSENFRFLAEPALLLAGDAVAAEAYADSDPDAALAKARRFSETLTKMLMRRAGRDPDAPQYQRINALAQAGVIPEHIRQLLHTIRRSGNQAVHEYFGDRETALAMVQACFDLGAWWYQNETGQAVGHEFTAPAPAEAASLREMVKGVEEQITRLRQEFEEALRGQAVPGPAAVPAGPRPAEADAVHPDPPATVATFSPAMLEVHNAAAVGQDPGNAGAAPLTAYMLRDHDRRLRELLEPVLAGGPSRLIVLTGESSTGKTRALYEAQNALAADRVLRCPADAGDLLALLESGEVGSGTVLWLNETQRFLYGPDGERAAARLRRALERSSGIAALGTLWSPPYWSEFTSPGLPGDPHAQARALLTHPGFAARVPVPARLTPDELKEWQASARADADPRPMRAFEAGLGDGRVIQQLSGGPELLQAYLAGPGAYFTPREHALITAALDARRLGHYAPIRAALLAEAADGTLRPGEHAEDSDWAREELRALATGTRADQTSTSIRGALTALTEVRARAGAEPGYEPADYLDQQTRPLRARHVPPSCFWTAAVHFAVPDNLFALSKAAKDRGLLLDAARLGKRAIEPGGTTWGSTTGATDLIRLMYSLNPQAPDPRPARWAAANVSLDDALSAANLLAALRETGAEEQVGELLGRFRAADVSLEDCLGVAHLLDTLLQAGAGEQLSRLLARDRGTRITPENSRDTTRPPTAVLAAGAEEQAGELLDLDPAARVSLKDSFAVALLLIVLRHIRADEQVTELLDRFRAAEVPLSGVEGYEAIESAQVYLGGLKGWEADTLLATLAWAGAGEQATALARHAAAHFPLDNPSGLNGMIQTLWQVGAAEQSGLLARRAVADAPLDNPHDVAMLLLALAVTKAEEQGTVLLVRLVGSALALPVSPDDPASVTRVLDTLREPRSDDQEIELATALLGHLTGRQDPATFPDGPFKSPGFDLTMCVMAWAHPEGPTGLLARRVIADLCFSTPGVAALLLHVLWQEGAEEQAAALARRVAAEVSLSDPAGVGKLLSVLCLNGTGDEAATLIDRLLALDPAARIPLDDPRRVALVLILMRLAGTVSQRAEQAAAQAAVLLDRDPAAAVSLDDPGGVARLLAVLLGTDATGQVTTLLGRDPADRVSLGSSDDLDGAGVANLLEALREARAEGQIRALMNRLPAEGHFALFCKLTDDPAKYRFGREPDGSQARSWGWDDLASPRQ